MGGKLKERSLTLEVRTAEEMRILGIDNDSVTGVGATIETNAIASLVAAVNEEAAHEFTLAFITELATENYENSVLRTEARRDGSVCLSRSHVLSRNHQMTINRLL